MKKYLLMGLTILIGTNLIALSGVAYNRMGETTAKLTLTEREVSLPYTYNSGAQKENSGTSLTINWRTPTETNESYYPYNSRELKTTKDELLALGFKHFDAERNHWIESRELYWALEFDGAQHKAAIEQATLNYQTALKTFDQHQNDVNQREINAAKEHLKKEKTTNSRLFVIEASADYQSLAAKFTGQQNILIVKGLAKPYYRTNDNTFGLMLMHLSVRSIMVPLEFTEALSELSNLNRQNRASSRYAVDINWGSRLEPWIVNVYKLVN